VAAAQAQRVQREEHRRVERVLLDDDRQAATARTIGPPTQLTHGGSRARRSRKGLGKESTPWRYGALGNTRSTRCAAVSAMRRAVQDGQMPRRLQLLSGLDKGLASIAIAGR
jgi:hypothetical protein